MLIDPSHCPAHWVRLAFMVITSEADPVRESLEARIHGNTMDDAGSGVRPQPALTKG